MSEDSVEAACDLFEAAIRDGYPTPANKVDQCEHGKFGWEDCIACYDEALLTVVEGIRARHALTLSKGSDK